MLAQSSERPPPVVRGGPAGFLAASRLGSTARWGAYAGVWLGLSTGGQGQDKTGRPVGRRWPVCRRSSAAGPLSCPRIFPPPESSVCQLIVLGIRGDSPCIEKISLLRFSPRDDCEIENPGSIGLENYGNSEFPPLSGVLRSPAVVAGRRVGYGYYDEFGCRIVLWGLRRIGADSLRFGESVIRLRGRVQSYCCSLARQHTGGVFRAV